MFGHLSKKEEDETIGDAIDESVRIAEEERASIKL
jgi:hypothetical protein